MPKLVVEEFPLNGSRLIEASAGTGKTYTISGLYLRLLLERDIDVTKILVVTFTEAATQELRGRIRKRLYDALRFIEGKSDEDDFADMLQPYKENRDIIRRLRDAVTRMDEASIYTIHGFSQRTLTDSAFESGVLFDAEFVTDESELRQQIARDFWRRRVVDASEAEAAWVVARWKTPNDLLSDVSALVANPEMKLVPDPASFELQSLTHLRDELYEKSRYEWTGCHEDIQEMLIEHPQIKTGVKGSLSTLFCVVPKYFNAPSVPEDLPTHFELLTQACLNSKETYDGRKTKNGFTPPSHAFFSIAEELVNANEALSDARMVIFMVEAADYIRSEIGRRKEKNRIMFFDDLLGKLDQALQGPGGDALAERVRQLYPVAMIDEFQDTDPVQYQIFSRVYKDAPDGAFFMIGDPKQAIYSFRGADIFTYMQARHDTDEATSHFTLDTNFRSCSSLVEGVNSFFSSASAPFIYKKDILFTEVSPAGDKGKADKKPLRLNGEIPSPLVCWHVPMTKENKHGGTITKGWASEHISRGCAIEIAQLLNIGQSGEAHIGERPLVAKDIAVLVRDRFEAADIRRALGDYGVASVYISRDSVFESDEARDLSHLLHAVADPRNPTLLRTALATRLMGMTARQIHEFGDDEIAWEERVLAFQHYQKIWTRHGFMPMFHTLLRQEDVIARLLSLPDGERRMTDVLQLAELAQIASIKHPGVENLLRWLADERAMPDGNVEDQQLRMESDEDLVQIVTIHKSKGLEYPIVFLPFIWASKAVKDKKVLTYHDEAQNILCADLGSDDREAAMALAEKERLAEELRLLYVAFTRAKYRCYFSWGQFYGAANSAMGYLLHQEVDETSGGVKCNMTALDEDSIRADIEKHNSEETTYIDVLDLPVKGERFTSASANNALPRPLTFSGHTEQQWRISSFSGITMDASHGQEYRVELPDHDQVMATREPVVVIPEAQSPFTFPRGAQAGLFLHHLYENIDFHTVDEEVLSRVVTKAMEQYGIDPKWHQVVVDWVNATLDTPLDAEGALALRNVPKARRLVELEFHFPVQGVMPQQLNALLDTRRGEEGLSATLDFATMTGMMKGFIDLIFEQDGRFYVLDYKSNHLGHRHEDYQYDSLSRAIEGHYYDLQYLIYTLALHRYLKLRLKGYDYEQHVGGVYYLFLRGMSPENGNRSGVYFDRPPLELIEQLEQCFFASAQEVQCA